MPNSLSCIYAKRVGSILIQSNKVIFKQMVYQVSTAFQSLSMTRDRGIPYSSRLTGSSGHVSWRLWLKKNISELDSSLALASGKWL